MAEETFILVMLVILMLIGSYVAGNIPLIMKLSEEKLKFATVLGAGLLVGTALTVIIPEGIRSLYSDAARHAAETVHHNAGVDASPIIISSSDPSQEKVHSHEQDFSRTIGLSLVLGFVFMMLVDQISQRRGSAQDQKMTATIGLVVHAAADGVALGAAATTSHQDTEIIVFLAIMLHKAPAAFGLVSFLLHEKIDRQQIRKHLAIFSLSAPLFTLLTYFGIGQEQKETLNSVNATGIAMLFSAGTFLYVATVHVLPEITHDNHHHSTPQYEYRLLNENTTDTEVSIENAKLRPTVPVAPSGHKGLSCSELTVMICGALLPLIITFGHSH